MSINHEKNLSICFSTTKFFALLSIIAAHITITQTRYGIFSKLFKTWGSIGVIVFIIVAGYYFHPKENENLLKFFKKKVGTIFIPWIFLGSMVFVYKCVCDRGYLTLVNYIKFMIGNGTYLYYLTVLVLCFVIFFKHNKIILYSAILVNIISLTLTSKGFLDNFISILHITNYLNIFNWIGLFALGILLRKVSVEKFYEFLKSYRLFSVIAFVFLELVIIIFSLNTGYFSKIGLLFELVSCWFVFSISTFEIFHKEWLLKVSNITLPIYIIHMVVIGVLDGIFNMNIVTKIISLPLVFIVSVSIVFAGYYISKILKLDMFYCRLLGIRTREYIKR